MNDRARWSPWAKGRLIRGMLCSCKDAACKVHDGTVSGCCAANMAHGDAGS